MTQPLWTDLRWLGPECCSGAGAVFSTAKAWMRVSVSCVSSELRLLARPGKRERREVRRSRSQSGRQRRCQSPIKAKEEKKGGQLLGSDGWSSSRLVPCMPQLNQVPATFPTREVWGTKYKSLLERTGLVPCCWPWLSSGAKLKCNNALGVWQRRNQLRLECEEKHQSRSSWIGWRFFVSLCR